MGKLRSKECFLELIKAFNELAEICGIDVCVTTSEPERLQGGPIPYHSQRKGDFFWLQRYLRENPTEINCLCGNFVAVYDNTIICYGPDEASTRTEAAQQVERDESIILVVPIRVPGIESEQCWENLKAELCLV